MKFSNDKYNWMLVGCLIMVVASSACNNERSTESNTETTAPVTTDGTSPSTGTVPTSTDAAPTTTNRLDTGTARPFPDLPEARKSATLGYSYPVKMHRGESKNINVYVLIRNQEGRIRDTLRTIVNEQSSEDGDSVNIFVTNVIWYKTLSINLIDNAGDFIITPIHNSDKQVIDTIDGNWWRWAIKTTTEKKVTEIILKVVAEKEDGTTDRLDAKTIHIQIQIDRNIVRRFVYYLTDNPAVSIPIVVSLIGFLGWYIKRRYDTK
ncbi:MAG TPA: hypothetical protein VF144_13895 [Chitinophagaceae bacterium]